MSVYIRVELPGVYTFWMLKSKTIERHPIFNARHRARIALSSTKGTIRREAIDPDNTAKLTEFAKACPINRKKMRVTYHERPGVASIVQDLNNHEMHEMGGKRPPLRDKLDITVNEFRTQCKEAIRNGSVEIITEGNDHEED